MTSKPHDALFRAAFEQPEHAAGLLRGALPATVADALAWDTLTREVGSFIDDDLADRHSDLLFSARMQGGTALLYLLLEHQSANDPDMPLRILVYMVRVLERARRERPGEKLPVVIPIVVSHAPGGWTAPRSLHALFEPDPRHVPGLAELVPGFTMVVEDLALFSNDDIKHRALDVFPQLAMWLLRDGREAGRLLDSLDEWLEAFGRAAHEPTGLGALVQLLRYIAIVTDDLHLEVFRAKLAQQAPEVARAAMTIAEQMRREGEAKGRAEGEAKGRAEGRAEGEAKGRAEGRAEILTKLMTLKFGAVAPGVVTRIEAGTSDELDRWVERVLTAAHVDDVFAD